MWKITWSFAFKLYLVFNHRFTSYHTDVGYPLARLVHSWSYNDGLVQERRNSSALVMDYVFLALTHRYNLSDSVNYIDIDIHHWYDLMKNIDFRWEF